MCKEILVRNLSELDDVAKTFLSEYMPQSRIFAFDAQMGAGKTTFIKAVCRLMDIDDVINSPTFSIVNEYYSKYIDDVVYHFDCYRMKDIHDAVNIGFEDYIYSGRYCFIEWPDVVRPLLPQDTVWISINVGQDNCRNICIKN